MKILCLLLTLFFFWIPVSEEEPYCGEIVRHFFTHALIAHPDIAFASGNEYGKHLDEDCVTPSEFKAFLEQAYENDYVLVDIEETFAIEGGKAVKKSFSFPKGKKPLILSIDDMVYASKNMGKGMVDKLVLSEGKIGTVSTLPTPEISFENESVSILESFLEKHPDFSHRGARGIFFLTGMEGIFGYRTQRDSLNQKTEIERVKPIVEKLKETGWKFGCHSYAHAHMKGCTAEEMRADLQKWKNEVEPLVGSTCLYAYPYGEWVLGTDCADERHKVLEEFGYKVFFGVGAKPFFTEMPLKSQTRVLFMDRSPLDGISLRQRRSVYLPVFDARTVYDACRPISYPAEG